MQLGKSTAAALIVAAFIAPSGSGGSFPNRQDEFSRNDRVHSARQGGTAAVIVRVDDGFDWTAAGIGAAGGIGLVFATAGALSGLRRREQLGPAEA